MILCDKHLLDSMDIPKGNVPPIALLAAGLMQLVNPFDFHNDFLELQCAVEDENNCPLCYSDFDGLPLLNWAKANFDKFHMEGDTIEYTFQE